MKKLIIVLLLFSSSCSVSAELDQVKPSLVKIGMQGAAVLLLGGLSLEGGLNFVEKQQPKELALCLALGYGAYKCGHWAYDNYHKRKLCTKEATSFDKST